MIINEIMEASMGTPSVQTTDNAWTMVGTVAIADDSVTRILVNISATDHVNDAAHWQLDATVVRFGTGTVSYLGMSTFATNVLNRTTGALTWATRLVLLATGIEVDVQGATLDTIDWSVEVRNEM